MKTMRGLLLIAAALAAVLMTPALATVGPKARSHRSDVDRPGAGAAQGGIHKVLQKLDLNDQQKTEIKGVMEANRQGLGQAREARRTSLQAFQTAVKAGEEPGIRTAATAVGSAMADAGVLRAKVWTAIKGVLTAEQLQQLAGLKDQGGKSGRPGDGVGQGKADDLRRVLARLDLTEQQKEQIKGILESHRQVMEQARQARAEALKAYGQAVRAGDESSIRSGGDAVGKAMADAAILRVQVRTAVKAVLTPEQIQKLEAMKARVKKVAAFAAGPAAERPVAAVRHRRAALLRALSNEKVFNRIDANGDGAITLDEIKALRRTGKAASNDL
jgi:Spy/CpxP family protein refolding chaperone